MRKTNITAKVEVIEERECQTSGVVFSLSEEVARQFIDMIEERLTYYERIKLIEVLMALDRCGFSQLAAETIRCFMNVVPEFDLEFIYELLKTCSEEMENTYELFMDYFFENPGVQDLLDDYAIKSDYMETSRELAEKLNIKEEM